jgi:hypothetical protein
VILLEDNARLLLLAHAILGAALVASTTHLVVWLRHYRRGRFGRHRAVRKFAWISASLFVATFLFGNLVYPTYKVRVRAQYLESPQAVAEAEAARRRAEQRTLRRENQRRELLGQTPIPVEKSDPAPGASDLPRQTAKIARWFDVKEHWVALGMAMSIGLLLLVTVWDPRKDGANIAHLVFWMAVGTAATTWLGAVIGIVVSSYRAVGPTG